MATIDPILEWLPTEEACHKCGQTGYHFYRVKESFSGAHEDSEHRCLLCGKDWWVDGLDY